MDRIDRIKALHVPGSTGHTLFRFYPALSGLLLAVGAFTLSLTLSHQGRGNKELPSL
jgi:hypothetical protein